MKRDFRQVVKDQDGRPHFRAILKYDEKGLPVVENNQQVFSHNEPVTLRWYALDALAGRWPGEEKLDGSLRMKVYLKLLTSADGVVDIEASEIQEVVTAMKNQGRSFLVIDTMERMLNTDPPKEGDKQ